MNRKTSKIERLNSPSTPKKKILILACDQSRSALIDALIDYGCEVYYSTYTDDITGYDLVISSGYHHLLTRDMLNKTESPIFNLHISYLPYNRGTQPNFWAFYDNTPSGVTIHLIDEGIDTGPIVLQKKVEFDRGETTFAATYERLLEEVENLFIANLDDLVEGRWEAVPQQGAGSLHRDSDLPSEFAGWDVDIEPEIARLKRLKTTAPDKE